MSIELKYSKLRFAVMAKSSEGNKEWFQPLVIPANGAWAVPEDGLKFPDWIGLAATTKLANPDRGVEVPSHLRTWPATK